jgi:ABC-type Fe3+/spermidine/putrescine transport system ATPase subunit
MSSLRQVAPLPIAQRQIDLVGVCKRFGVTVTADDFSLGIDKGEFFTFLGPSGSGKSTLLRMVAGLETPDAGRILMNGRDLAGVPPWQRNLGMMFQQYALFPHMTVAENVAYGLKSRGVGAGPRRARVQEMLEMVGLANRAAQHSTVLSGGEQQRVALARALAPAPEVLLLDEPLSALDEKIRREMQLQLKHIQRRTGTTFFYVTHDQEEALTMSDRIAVINNGRCVQCDAPDAIFRRPRTRFVAGFFRGCNVVDAAVEAGGHHTMAHVAGLSIRLPAGATGSRSIIGLAIRAEDLRVGAAAEAMPLSWSAALDDVIYKGTSVDHILRLSDGQAIVATSTRREIDQPAASVRVGVHPARVVVLED